MLLHHVYAESMLSMLCWAFILVRWCVCVALQLQSKISNWLWSFWATVLNIFTTFWFVIFGLLQTMANETECILLELELKDAEQHVLLLKLLQLENEKRSDEIVSAIFNRVKKQKRRRSWKYLFLETNYRCVCFSTK